MAQPAYFSATRHPWPCLVFLLPLLLAYEGGIVWLGGAQPEALRNGADTWLHWGLDAFGLRQLYWVPGIILVLLCGWAFLRRKDQPEDLLGICTGMGIESVVFALGLWGISRGLNLGADSLRSLLTALQAAPSPAVPGGETQVLGSAITFVGAGIYEEVLFRLLLFSGLLYLLRHLQIVPGQALLAAGAVSALVFSIAHHVGPYGEPFDTFAFVFRFLAGIYFTILFQLRGFGIAVGAHACYDVLVGVVVN